MSAIIAKTVALLDVDHTLLFKDCLNEPLLLALKSKGVKDIYPFTDMLFTETSIPERLELVKKLSSKPYKFNVHGVIAPSDVLWSYLGELPKQSLEDLFQALIIEYKGRFDSSEFTPVFQEEISRYDELKKLDKNFQTQYAQPGSSFEALSQSADSELSYKISMLAKAMIEQLPGYNLYKDPKGFMFELFLYHFRDSFKHVIVADDKEIVIDAIQLVDCSPLSLFPILVTSSDMTQVEYNKLLITIPTKSSSLSKFSSFFSRKQKSHPKVEEVEEIANDSSTKNEDGGSQGEKIETHSDLAHTDYDGDISSSDDENPPRNFIGMSSHRAQKNDDIVFTL